jgi:hypothetical protein
MWFLLYEVIYVAVLDAEGEGNDFGIVIPAPSP